MKKLKVSIILEFLASICFFIVYFVKGKETLYLIFGFTWLSIALGNTAMVLNDKEAGKKEKK